MPGELDFIEKLLAEPKSEKEHLISVADLHIDDLLRYAASKGASDLHFSAGLPPMLRIDGKLVPSSEHEVMTARDIQRLIYDVMTN